MPVTSESYKALFETGVSSDVTKTIYSLYWMRSFYSKPFGRRRRTNLLPPFYCVHNIPQRRGNKKESACFSFYEGEDYIYFRVIYPLWYVRFLHIVYIYIIPCVKSVAHFRLTSLGRWLFLVVRACSKVYERKQNAGQCDTDYLRNFYQTWFGNLRGFSILEVTDYRRVDVFVLSPSYHSLHLLFPRWAGRLET